MNLTLTLLGLVNYASEANPNFRISIPRKQRLTLESLLDLIEKVKTAILANWTTYKSPFGLAVSRSSLVRLTLKAISFEYLWLPKH
ncbi:hypothetical protein [Nostoc sp. NMS8]|uniref:hypothetical protein n=1 Tax=Nostoc sp. NMS8 TaxID=2815392 RepID=UPI0025D6B5E3|nr:hypothetical protein [Nostoc sp. NMS8]MBN3961523.1 hypothetical protein [Nostoc sp. NMS8]